MSQVKASPNFRKLLAGAAKGEVIVPLLRTALFDPDFADFNIQVRGFTRRPPDGWFHPSTHPMLNERALYHYLVNPESMIDDIRDPHSVMAVTQGSFWHDFVQHVLLGIGVLQRNPTPSPGMNEAEWFWKHEATKSRGHSDGLTDPKITFGYEEIFEFKSMSQMRMRHIPKGEPDDPQVLRAFRKMVPEYHAQGQEYMRLSNRRRWRCVLMAIEYPYPMREITMEYDPFFAGNIAMKYERVLSAAEAGQPPMVCCGSPKTCMASAVCEMGKRVI